MIVKQSAQGTPRKLRHGKAGVHGQREARSRAEERHQNGRIAVAYAVGDSHIAINGAKAPFAA